MLIKLNNREFLEIVTLMREDYGINLDKKKVLVECRLAKEVEKYGTGSFERYLQMLRADKSEKLLNDMVSRLTTNYTYFMREPVHFSVLREQVLPEMAARVYSGFFNIWCAGCSTGEESYTLAMLLQDYKDRTEWISSVRIVAGDISADVLEQAEKGVYPLKDLERLPVEWQKKYCRIIDKKNFEFNEKLKLRPCFRKQNLLAPSEETEKFDVIFCRNVMIYFDRKSKDKLLRRLESSLRPGGYLFVGLAELLSREETGLQSVSPAVYKKQ